MEQVCKLVKIWRIYVLGFMLGGLSVCRVHAGNKDSLLSVYRNLNSDSLKIYAAISLSGVYLETNADSSVYYALQALARAVKGNNREGQAHASEQLGTAYKNAGKRDKAMEAYTEALRIYMLTKNRKQTAEMLNNIGALHYESSHYDKALDCFKKSLKIRELIGNQSAVAASYSNIGAAYKQAGEYLQALDYFFRALKLGEVLNKKVTVATIMANIAHVYSLTGKYQESIAYANRSLQISRQINDPSLEIRALGMIAQDYFSRQQYKQAEATYKQALDIATKIKEVDMMADFNASLGMIYCETRQYEKALNYYEKGRALSHQINDIHYLSQSYLGLGKVYLAMGNYTMSIRNLEKGLELTKQGDMPTVLVDLYGVLGEAYGKAHRYEKAYEYVSEYRTLRDSIYKLDEKEAMQKLHFDHELYKKHQEIILLENEKALQAERDNKQRLTLIFLAIVLGLALLIIYFLFNGNRKERKSKKLIASQKVEIQQQALHLEELNNLKTRTFSIISHDLRNPIAGLNMLIELMNKKLISNERFLEAMQDINGQLYALNAVLENLLVWSKSQMEGHSDPRPGRVNLFMLAEQSIGLLNEGAHQKNVTLLNQVSPNAVVYADNEHIDIVIRNLLANAIKFTPGSGKVVISSVDEGDRVRLVVKDTGVGMTRKIINSLFSYRQTVSSSGTSGEKGTGLGLLLCKEFIDKNGGNIFVESEEGKGSRFSFDLPKAG